jgi:hypothetical protein
MHGYYYPDTHPPRVNTLKKHLTPYLQQDKSRIRFGTQDAIRDKHKGCGTPAFIKEASLAKKSLK